MAQKGEWQGRRTPDAVKSGPQLTLDFVEMVSAEIREFAALDVAPYELDGIEVGRVAGQALDREPRTLHAQEGLHGSTLVRREAIPDQDDAPTAKLPLEVGQEVHEGYVVVAARARLEEETTALEVPAEAEGEGDGQLLPVERVDQDRGLAAGRPRAADRGPLGDATLVLEDNPGAAPSSVFFTAGQRVVIQCWMAASFRSLACLAGRCNVQSSAPRRRQTCPG